MDVLNSHIVSFMFIRLLITVFLSGQLSDIVKKSLVFKFYEHELQYVASVGSGYQHQKGAKVLLTT